MKRSIVIPLFLIYCFLPSIAFSQENINTFQTDPDYENIAIHKLYSDSLSTGFIIWVKNGVKAHVHKYHSESIYVIEGEGEMVLDGKPIPLLPGVFVSIPIGMVHSVTVSSELPIKVLSVQSPEFFGKDRFFIETQE